MINAKFAFNKYTFGIAINIVYGLWQTCSMASFLVQRKLATIHRELAWLPLNVTAFTKPTEIENGRVEIGIIALPGLAYGLARISPGIIRDSSNADFNISKVLSRLEQKLHRN